MRALVVAFLMPGAVFGALSPRVIDHDFGFAQRHVSMGAALLIALSIGWLPGGALCRAGSGSAQRRKFAPNRSSGNPA